MGLSKISYLLTFIVSFLTPIAPAMMTVGLLVFADTFTGIWAAKHKKQKITSHKLKRTISKVLLYNVSVITGFMIESYMIDFIPFVKIVLGAIATVEFYSLIENVSVVTGNNIAKYIMEKMDKIKKRDEEI